MSQTDADFDIYDFYAQLDLEAAFRNSWRDEWNREQAAWDEWKQAKDAHTAQWLNHFDYNLTFDVRFKIEYGYRRSWQEWRDDDEWRAWINQEQGKADWLLVTRSWHEAVSEEWSAIRRRELTAWFTWQKDQEAEHGIADLRSFLGNGSNGSKPVEFTSEGGISQWQQRYATEWFKHVCQPQQKENAYFVKCRSEYRRVANEYDRWTQSLLRPRTVWRREIVPPIRRGRWAESHCWVSVVPAPTKQDIEEQDDRLAKERTWGKWGICP